MPAIKRIAFTRANVESAPARENPYRLWDATVPGLCLRVMPTGTKTYEVYFDRKQSARIGQHPTITLAGARAQAQEKRGAFSKTGIRPDAPSRTGTLRAFLETRYKPWVTTERKTGVRTVATIEAQFATLLDKPLSAVTAWSVEKWKSDRLKAGTNPATVNRDLNRIKAALAKAVEWGVLSDHPLRSVKRARGEDSGRVRYLSETEEKALRKALETREAAHRQRRDSGNAWRTQRGVEELPAMSGYVDHLAPMVLLALNSGLRRGELTAITWDDVNLPGRMLTVRAGYAKSGRARHVPLNTEAVTVLRRWKRDQGGGGRLFPILDPKKAWAALLVDAKIKAFRFHDLRHTFASNLVMGGVDLNTVRELLGHADMAMTLRYAHLAPEHKAAAVEVLMR